MKDVLPAGVELGCHAGKRSGQVVETLDLGVRQRYVVEDKAHFLPRIEALGQLNAFSQPKLDPRRKFDRVLFSAIGKVSERKLPAECLIPIDVPN